MDNNKLGVVAISRRQLLDVWRQGKTKADKNLAVFSYIRETIKEQKLHHEEDVKFKQLVNNFNSKLSEKWKKYAGSLKTLLSQETAWLDKNIDFPILSEIDNATAGPSGIKSGRPKKKYEELSLSSKKRRIQPLVQLYTTEELLLAAQSSLRQAGRRDAANIIHEIAESSPKRATRIKQSWNRPSLKPIKYTPEEALAMYIDGHHTKHSYVLMQSGAKARFANIYPPYNTLLNAKKECYPSSTSVTIKETSAEIKIQGLIDHTIGRLVEVQKEVLTEYTEELAHGLTCYFKWGCDGSSGHSVYNQIFAEEDIDGVNVIDSTLFAICLVPLQLRTNRSNKIIWHNLTPSSTRFCRPIKLLFAKETTVLTKFEIENVEKQIQNLVATRVFVSEKEVIVGHVFKLTMIDGKTFGVIADTSTQSCGICKTTPKNMNKLEVIQQQSFDTSKYEHGLSSLHAWIRCFECVLHIAYRLDVKKWQTRTKEDKLKVENRKKQIQSDLRSELGLLVDIPKQGCGTSNTGNIAYRFFENHEVTASITGLDQILLKQFYVILQTISCGYDINIVEFTSYVQKTAERYVNLYPWYNMPSSVHKLLIHGPDIIKAAVLPIGMFSEESIEARNKDFKRYRERNTRKFSRKHTMTDLINTLLYTSGPVITSISKRNTVRSYNSNVLDENVNRLLMQPSISSQDQSDSD